MAKHRIPKKRRVRKSLVAAATAAGISGSLVLALATTYTAEQLDLTLANTVLGVGGRGDPTAARIPAKLGGDIAPAEFNGVFDYVGIEYPASFNFEASTNEGVPKLAAAVANTPGAIRITSYSAGTLVAEQVKRDLDPPAPGDPTLDFLFIASPYLPNGGLFARFPGFRIPGILPEFSAAEPSPYDSTYVVNMYDPYGDAPAYFNPVSIANSLFGIMYAHPDQYYDDVDLDTAPKYTYETTNSAGGHDTYVLLYNPQLPLFGPVRQIAALTMLTPFTEPLIGVFEPLVRLIVDMGYTDRINANPAAPTAFSLITPPAKFIEAALGVPGALGQGAANLTSGGQSALNTADQSINAFSAPEPAPPQAGDDAPQLRLNATEQQATDPEPPKGPEGDDDKNKLRISHPTLTSDGNMATPTVTAGTTPATGGQPVAPVVGTGPNPTADAQGPTAAPGPEAGPAPAASPAGGTAPASGEDKKDEAA